MPTTATTLAGAIGPSDWIIALASQANLKPNDNIVLEQESLRALVVLPGAAIVFRGARGTAGKAHAAGVAATYGSPSDYGVGVGPLMVALEASQSATDPFVGPEDTKREDTKREDHKREDPPANHRR